MVGPVGTEEGPRRALARGERNGSRLERSTCGLVLQADRGKVRAEGDGKLRGIAPGRTHQLQEIGGITDGAFTTSVRDPGMPPALCQILPRHQDGAHLRIASDVVIEVLTRVRLVVHQETALAEADILDEDGVAGEHNVTAVVHLHTPHPEILIRKQLQGNLMRNAASLADPDEALVGRSDTAARVGASDRDDLRFIATDAQANTPHAAGDT
jgi:hypothetical protein